MSWPRTPEELARAQHALAELDAAPWAPPASTAVRLGACAVVSGGPGPDELAWAAAVVLEGARAIGTSSVVARVSAPFWPGQLALREGPILEAAVARLDPRPDLLVVAAAGRDHSRGAGLAVQLGAILDLPTIGVTDRPLLARGPEPGPARGSREPLRLREAVVAYRVRSRAGARDVVAHAGWRTTAEVAADVVLASCVSARWPEPMRAARRLARTLRAGRACAAPG